jgi:DNA-binding IclR family transcriptional regulator
MKPEELIFQALQTSGEPMKAGDIAATTKLDKKEVDKAMKTLKSEGRIVSPKRCFWTAV